MNKFWLCVVGLSAHLYTFAQQTSTDSVRTLQPIDLKVYFVKQSLLSSTTSLHHIHRDNILQQSNQTLLPALNTVSGIRMEERSPGSYRIAMRGSLIRSPFGVRNTKVYMDEIPLTDAGGNTYINLVNPDALSDIMIIKGPDGSLYGANSGGIIKLTPLGFGTINNAVDVNLGTGSYGLFNQQIGIQHKKNKNYQFAINQSFTRSDGYRENSALNKKVIETSQQWDINATNQIRFLGLYADLAYQTPGGLTLEQYQNDPRQARPRAGKNPGAAEQKAAIYNKTLLGGLSYKTLINKNLSYNASIFGSNTDFKNPFITNYEIRKETNYGVRTYLSFDKIINNKTVQTQIGLEGIFGRNTIKNFDNEQGIPTQLQSNDKLNNQAWNLFYRSQIEVLKNWNIEYSIGLNRNKIEFEKYFPTLEQGNINFKTQWMPRVASSYHIGNMGWRMSYAKGYSTPTLGEVRSSTNEINTALQPEQGNNYEIGYKIKSSNQRLLVDIAAYTYTMRNGIMREVNEAGQEYFSNIGRLYQKGIETTIWAHIIAENPIIHKLIYQGALTYNHYRFGEGKSNGVSIEGNKVTAVPEWTWTNTLNIVLPGSFAINIYHNYTGKIPLNDANTAFANKYNLVQTKISRNTKINRRLDLDFYMGIDNLLNEKYSLGNDINAFGGRYYNPAPTRNFYVGLKAHLN